MNNAEQVTVTYVASVTDFQQRRALRTLVRAVAERVVGPSRVDNTFALFFVPLLTLKGPPAPYTCTCGRVWTQCADNRSGVQGTYPGTLMMKTPEDACCIDAASAALHAPSTILREEILP